MSLTTGRGGQHIRDHLVCQACLLHCKPFQVAVKTHITRQLEALVLGSKRPHALIRPHSLQHLTREAHWEKYMMHENAGFTENTFSLQAWSKPKSMDQRERLHSYLTLLLLLTHISNFWVPAQNDRPYVYIAKQNTHYDLCQASQFILYNLLQLIHVKM